MPGKARKGIVRLPPWMIEEIEKQNKEEKWEPEPLYKKEDEPESKEEEKPPKKVNVEFYRLSAKLREIAERIRFGAKDQVFYHRSKDSFWLSGDTYKYKDLIKSNGFKWDSENRAWYGNKKSLDVLTPLLQEQGVLVEDSDARTVQEVPPPIAGKETLVYARGYPYGAPLVRLRGAGTQNPELKAWLRRAGFNFNASSFAWETYLGQQEFAAVLQKLSDAGYKIRPKEGMRPELVIPPFE